ncbi:hypothetical protein FGADI_6274 [Fusarium gaditjirri]|uniref:Ankyrin n=1 Tax=Fusarium gaditjirri TaxID=282569 RepID=A0A8H4T8A6_9HYPO|nr:hypothetical protein FGADI_6274 [Fusarium gaditjirri]
MADPLSISASIAGLVALADLVFRSGTKYVKSYRGTSMEVGNLVREIRSLSVILHNLSLVAFDLEEAESSQPIATQEPRPVLQPHHLHDCHQLLRRLETGLARTEASLNSDSGRQRLQARLKWPFTSTESKGMVQDIQRYTQVIHTALAADSLAKLKYCLSRQAEVKGGLDKISRTMERILDIQVKITLDTKRNQVLRDFGQVNPRGEYEINRKLRHGLTGLWLTQGPDFDCWYSTPASRLWCSGIPGAGKSVLSAAMIEECLRRNAHDASKAIAYFFCTYKNERSHHSVTIFSSLCMQLAMQSEDAFQILQEYHDQLFSNHHLSTKPTAEMLAQMLHRICACFTRVYIIIDGIDECDTQVEANVECLAKLVLSQVDDVINMALFSRDESIIRTRLENDFPHVEIEAHAEDLQLYVASELSERIASKRLRLRDYSLKDLIMTRLVGEAKGMFRWVACQLDYMCELPTDKARREALDKLPPTLYQSYDRILLKTDGYDDSVKRLVKRALLLLAASHFSLRFEEICEAISLEDDATTLDDDEIVEEEDLLRWCSSLVRVNKSSSSRHGKTRIQFAHFTVQEYLQSLTSRNLDHQHAQLSAHLARLQTVQLLLNVSDSPLAPPLPSETIISLALSCPDTFSNNVEVIIELLKAGVCVTAQDIQLFRVRYNRCLQMPSFSSKIPHMWSMFPQLLEVLGENNTPGCPRFILRQETEEFILKTSEVLRPQSPEGQPLEGASREEVLRHIQSLIRLNDGTGMSAFLATPRAELAQSTDIDPEHPGWNALHLALLEKSYRVLGPLLAFGLDPRADNPDGYKPIHMCCRGNTCEALRILLRFGGSILDTDNLGRTVWHLAAEMNSTMVLEELFNLGNVGVALKMVSKHHETPICAAATRLHLEAVSLLLPFCKTEEYWTSSKSLSLILYEPRFSKVLQSLYGFGILSQTSCGMHALACAFYLAILKDDVQTCEKLHGLGCPLECEMPFPVVMTPLGQGLGPRKFFLDISGNFIFKSTSRLESLSAIINQKDIRHQNQTPLFMAAAQNNAKAADALIVHGADVNATDDRNCTPLFVAVEHDAIDVAELLISRGAHVDIMNTSSYGLFDVVVVQKSWRMVDILLKAGLSSRRINVDGRNLLSLMTLWTCRPGTKPNIGLFKRLLEHGVDLNLCDKFSYSALHGLFTSPCRGYLLCMMGTRLESHVGELSSWPDPFFSKGIDSLVGVTYNLRYVKPSIKIEGVRQLCGLGTPGAHSLLCRAACWGSVTAIQNLIKVGISDLEHRCREHGSPLNAAIQSRKLEVVKFLMLHGAKVPEHLCKSKDSSLSITNPDFVIRQWLFVGSRSFSSSRRIHSAVGTSPKYGAGLSVLQSPPTSGVASARSRSGKKTQDQELRR